MQELVVIGDRRIKIGDKLRSNNNANDNGLCPPNMLVTVKTFRNDGEILIGLCSDQRVDGWGNLDGKVLSRTGYWASRDCIMDNFDYLTNDHEVIEDYKFKGVNLRGMSCVLLHHDQRNGQCFVELDEDVGGGSADGMGRKGHCVVVPASKLNKKSPFLVKKSTRRFGGDVPQEVKKPSVEEIKMWVATSNTKY